MTLCKYILLPLLVIWSISEGSNLLSEFEAIPFSLTIEVEGESPIELHTEGEFLPKDGGWELILDRLEGAYLDQNIYLEKPAEITFTDQEAAVSPFVLHYGPATLIGEIQCVNAQLHGYFDLTTLQLEELPTPLFLSGSVTGRGTIGGSIFDPLMEIHLQGDHVVIEEVGFKEFPEGNGNLRITLNSHEAFINGTFLAEPHPPVHFSAQIPVKFGLAPFHFDFDNERELKGELVASGDITPLLQLIPTSAISLAAQANASFKLGGTLKDPKLYGTCELINGIFENPATGILVRDIHAVAEADGKELRITRVTASAGPGSKIEGTGHVVLDPELSFPFELLLDVEHASVLRMDYLQAVGGGKISFHGDGNKGAITGKVVAEQGVLTIPDHTRALMDPIEVTYINVPNGEMPPLPEKNPDPWALHFDLLVDIPRTLTIQGKDFSSVWKGEIRVAGSDETLLLFGDVRASHGQYMFNGKPFSLDQGTVTLAGDWEKKTTMYVIASRDLGEVKVDVIVKGGVKNPEISFRSNPPMSQREILSWILFNRGTSEISPFQGSQLNESITNLDTSHQGPDVLTKLRTATGIDCIEISRDEGEDGPETALQVGKYISNNIFIGVRTRSDVNRIAVEAALSDRIRLEAQVGDDSQGRILFKWKRDY